jgi:hypothetical protein
MNRKLDDGLSPRTVQLSLVILRKALGRVLKDGLIARRNWLTAHASNATKVRRLTPEQARAFLDPAKGERLEALYVAALSLGLRMGEGLRWQDIGFERRTLTVNRILRAHRPRRGLDGRAEDFTLPP